MNLFKHFRSVVNEEALSRFDNSNTVNIAKQGMDVVQSATQTASTALGWVKMLVIMFSIFCVLLVVNLVVMIF